MTRSFLFVPADSERKLAKGAESGADALILDLEDFGCGGPQGRRAADGARLSQAACARGEPAAARRARERARHRPDRRRPRCRGRGPPGCDPAAQGRRRRGGHASRCQAHRARGAARAPRRRDQDPRARDRNGRIALSLRHLPRRESAAHRHHLGRRRPLRRARRGDEPRRGTGVSPRPIGSRAISRWRRRRPRASKRSTRSMRTSATWMACVRKRSRRGATASRPRWRSIRRRSRSSTRCSRPRRRKSPRLRPW